MQPPHIEDHINTPHIETHVVAKLRKLAHIFLHQAEARRAAEIKRHIIENPHVKVPRIAESHSHAECHAEVDVKSHSASLFAASSSWNLQSSA